MTIVTDVDDIDVCDGSLLLLKRAGNGRIDVCAKAKREFPWPSAEAAWRHGSGLSVMVISRMLSAPRLPPVVRTKILEYVREKTDGVYGHGK